MTASTITLPVVTIQNTFADVLQEVHDGVIPFDKFWVSCYKSSEPSVHAKVHAELDDHDRNLVRLKPVEDNIEIEKDAYGNYAITCQSLNIPPTKVLTPLQEYQDAERANPARPHRITAFAISPDSSRFATGYLDGSIFLYPTSPLPSSSTSSSSSSSTEDDDATNHRRPSLVPQAINTTKQRIPSKPHLSGITSLQFFPSSRVLLSTGIDFALTILPADLPPSSSTASHTTTPIRITPVRTLRAHTHTVTASAIIALGRNILSSSLDCTIKLWDVSSGDVLSSLPASSPVRCMSLGRRVAFPVPPDGVDEVRLGVELGGRGGGEDEARPQTGRDERELAETSSKIVFAGLDTGSFELFDLGLKKSVYTSSRGGSGGLTAIAYAEEQYLLATGSAGGVVEVFDTRTLGTPLTAFRRLETSVSDLAFVVRSSNAGSADSRSATESATATENATGTSLVSLAIATSDGLPYIASVVPEGPAVFAELVGADCDPVQNVCVRSTGSGGRRVDVWSASHDGIVRRYGL